MTDTKTIRIKADDEYNIYLRRIEPSPEQLEFLTINIKETIVRGTYLDTCLYEDLDNESGIQMNSDETEIILNELPNYNRDVPSKPFIIRPKEWAVVPKKDYDDFIEEQKRIEKESGLFEIKHSREEQIKIIKGLDDLWSGIKADSEEKMLEIQDDAAKMEYNLKESLINKKDKYIKELIKDEVKLANLVHKPFATKHEGYAVLKEEIEEAQDELLKITGGLGQLWDNIKMDLSSDTIEVEVDNIEERATKAIKELIQVGAMCKKFQIYLEGEEKDGE